MGKAFILQSEGRLYGEFIDRSEHDTYEKAEEAVSALEDAVSSLEDAVDNIDTAIE